MEAEQVLRIHLELFVFVVMLWEGLRFALSQLFPAFLRIGREVFLIQKWHRIRGKEQLGGASSSWLTADVKVKPITTENSEYCRWNRESCAKRSMDTTLSHSLWTDASHISATQWLIGVSACRLHQVDTYPWNESLITPGKCFCLFIFSHLHPLMLHFSQVAALRSGPQPALAPLKIVFKKHHQ